jgi:opacity protein-like surface antigen
MGRSKIAALVGAALFFLPSAGAFAADIPEIPQPAHFGGNWYLKGYIGMTNQHFTGLDHPTFAGPVFFEWLDRGNFDAVPLFGVGIGFRHSEHLRFDATAEWRGKSAFSALDRYDTDGPIPPDFDGVAGPDWGTNHYTGKKAELLFLANAYWDLNSWNGITPYVGAGIGASYNTIYDFVDENVPAAGGGFAPTGHKLSFAWALHAGASMQLSDNISLDFGYSFVNLGDAQTGPFQNFDPTIGCAATPGTCVPMNFRGIYSHDFKVGLRYAFGGSGASYYPPVVKY